MHTLDGIDFHSVQQLDDPQIGQVSRVLDLATMADSARPLSEHAWLHLRAGGDTHAKHILAVAEGGTEREQVVGYAHIDITDEVEGPSAEIVVAPDYRNRHIGRELVRQAIELSPDGRLRLWAHGETPGAQALAARLGFALNRSLWQMRRSLFAPLPALELPPGISIRTFNPRTDIHAWLGVNSRSFAALPDQGGWTRTDLERRLAESWFRPEGFFIAERTESSGEKGAEMVGFHWTKVHGDQHGLNHHSHEPIGEVYVLAVDPSAGVKGLGRALTIVGLSYLRNLGLAQAMLYVDSSNTRAIDLYTTLGFVHWDTDVMFKRVHQP